MMKKKYLKRRTENGGGAAPGMVRFSSSDVFLCQAMIIDGKYSLRTQMHSWMKKLDRYCVTQYSGKEALVSSAGSRVVQCHLLLYCCSLLLY